MRKSPRDRRLNSDFQSVHQLQVDSTIFSFQAIGDPPQRYRMTFKGAGFKRDPSGRIVVSSHHELIVDLGAAYPRMVPNLAWQTPIFHPNISNNGVVCLGGYGTHWVPSLTLSEMCTMLWEMIRYKNFDSESPYNREAALWAKHQTDFKFPIDPRSIRDRISGVKTAIVPAELRPSVIPSVPLGQPVSGPPLSGREVEILETGIEIIEQRDNHRPNQDDILYIN